MGENNTKEKRRRATQSSLEEEEETGSQSRKATRYLKGHISRAPERVAGPANFSTCWEISRIDLSGLATPRAHLAAYGWRYLVVMPQTTWLNKSDKLEGGEKRARKSSLLPFFVFVFFFISTLSSSPPDRSLTSF